MNNDHIKIVQLLEKYFDLLYNSDVDLIDQLFLPDAYVYNVSDGEVIAINMDQFHQRIENRQSPKSLNMRRDDRILSIDIAAPTIALAKVDVYILPAGHFTDYLTLMKVADVWKITSKVFHMDPSKNE